MIFDIDQKEKNHIALIEDGREMTYKELTEAIDARCQFFEKQGLCAGKLMFLVCDYSIETVVAYLACLQMKVVPLLIDERMAPEIFDELKETYQPHFVWKGHAMVRNFDGDTALYPDLALLLATSGSTGSPKLVRLSLENVCHNAASIVEYLEITENDRAITTLPMHYTYGLSVVHSHLLAGAQLILTGKSVVQQEFWTLAKEKGATSVAGVPYTYQMLDRMGIFDGDSAFTCMTQAGGKLPERLQKKVAAWAKEHGVRFYIMYGQTEATARMGYLPYDKCLEKNGSMGIVIPGGKFWLRDEDGGCIDGEDQVGELMYEGANVSLGYASCRDDLALGDENQGVLATGDMAKRDADGYYYIVGRKKRFVKLFGVRISLDSCEQLLKYEFPTSDFACVGDDRQMQIFVTDASVCDDVAMWLAEKLQLSARAFAAIYIEEIPKNNSGKVAYERLKSGF